MKNYFGKKWITALLIFTFVCTIYLNKNGSAASYASGAFAGGNILCFDQCLTEDNKVTLTFPLISTYNVNNISFVSLDSDVNQYVKCSLSFDDDEITLYKDYKIYQFTLTITQKKGCTSAYNSIIEGINLEINDANYFYETPNFKLFNNIYLSNNDEYVVNNGDLELTDAPSQIFSIPTDENPLTNTLHSLGNCKIISMTPSAFVDFNTFTFNGKKIDAQNIQSTIVPDSTFNITYSLNYTEPKCNTCITKPALIIKYFKDGKCGIFVTNSPMLIFPGTTTTDAVKNYIDNIKH